MHIPIKCHLTKAIIIITAEIMFEDTKMKVPGFIMFWSVKAHANGYAIKVSA